MPTRRSTTTASRRVGCATPSGATARWKVRVIATKSIDGRPIGREPTLAISHHGMRLVVFRTEINLDEGQVGNGALYAARSPDGVNWIVERDRRQRLRRHARASTRRAGPRSPTWRASTRRSPPRCGWRTTTTAPGTSRRSRARPSGRRRARPMPRASGSRSTACRRSRSPTSIPTAIRSGSWARTRVRSASAPCLPSPARATIAFGANGEVGVVCAGLAGEDSRLWVATGRLGGANADVPGDGPVGQLGRDRRFLARCADRGLPRSPRRLRGRARQARKYRSSLIARASRYSAEQPVQRGLRGGPHEPGDGIGVALVANGALLVFAETAF